MNYSAYYPSILFMYFGTFAGIILAVALLIYGDIYILKQYIKIKSNIELVGFIVFFVAILVVLYFSRNYFKDIPNVVRKNYIITAGTAEGWDSAGQVHETREFAFKTDGGDTQKIVVTYPPVYQGDRFEVIYLPNTGYGAIIRKLEGGELP